MKDTRGTMVDTTKGTGNQLEKLLRENGNSRLRSHLFNIQRSRLIRKVAFIEMYKYDVEYIIKGNWNNEMKALEKI